MKKYVPDCAITKDIIVGFPGETEEDFKATLELVRKVDFASAFTFVYSRREGTKAASMPNQIPEEICKKRIMELVELVNAQTRVHSSKFVGQTVEVLCEDFDEKRKLYQGRNEYGRMVYFESKNDERGNFVNVKVNEANGVSLFGDKV